MAIGWLSLLKTVPWTQVISTAPVVVDGARKLWNGMAKKRAAEAATPEPAAAATEAEPESPARLQAQLAALEASVAELHQQMIASSELIKALAEQNAELIERVERNRSRLLWLWLVLTVLGAVALIHLLRT